MKNTGNVALNFGKLGDANCTSIAPSPVKSPVAAGGHETYTCNHELIAVGSYSNEASDHRQRRRRAARPPTRCSSNVPAEPSFTIEKLQEIEGSGAGFTKSKLTGKVGETVDYEIVVKNTGNVPLKFDKLGDAGCENITPSGEVTVPVGGEQTYTCEHLLAVGSYSNEASISGNEGTGTKTSNKVLVNVPAEPASRSKSCRKSRAAELASRARP